MSSALQQFIVKQLSDAKTDRADMSSKWDWNDLTMDGDGLPWKEQDTKGPVGPDGLPTWLSRLRYPLCRQRTDAAEFIAADALYPQNTVPFSVLVDDPDGAGPNEAPSGLRVTRRLKRWLAACDAVTEFQRVFRSAARYGDAWAQSYAMGSVADGVVSYGIEHVPNREVFQDWRKEQPEDGAYFFRVMSVRPAEAMDLLRGIEWVDAEAVRSAVRKAASVAQESAQAKDDLPSRPRTVDVVQAWVKVPQGKVLAWMADALDEVPPEFAAALAAGAGTATDDEDGEVLPVMAYLVGEELVGVLTNPGPCNVRRFVWREAANRVHGEGLPDLLWELQDAASGALRALDQAGKIASGAALGVDDSVAVGFSDVRKAISQGEVIRIRAGEDVRKLVQLLQIPVDLAPILAVLEKLVDLGDDYSPVQLAQAGQGGGTANTAYELQQRLENAGKFLLSVVRNFARFADPLLDELFLHALEQEAPEEAAALQGAHAKALFEASYLRKVELAQALTMILGAVAQSGNLARRVNWDKFLELMVGTTSLAQDELLLPADDPAVAAQAQADSMRSEAERLLLEAELAKAQAEAARAQATANELESRLALNEARASREEATTRVLDASITRDQARTANEIRKTVSAERAGVQSAGQTRGRVPDPGRAAATPGGAL